MRRSVSALVKTLALIALVAGAAPARAEPALWAIKNGRSTIYLFGTFHALESGKDWQSPKIANAFAASGEVWLELTDDDAATMKPLMGRLGLDPAHPLSSKLSTDDLGRIDAVAKTAGLPAGEKSLEPMRPWFAALSLTALPIVQAGFDPEDGADHVLKRQALAAGKKLQAFETAERQMHFFADLPAGEELSILRSSLDDIAAGPDKIKAMAGAWLDGDVAKIAALFAEFDDPKYRGLYKVLIHDRNQAWAMRLAERLKTGSGTSFVAVGAGHLAGPDSLLVALAKRGFTAERQ
jgi:uncharacterized protein YbaP (TraB family)